MPFGTASWGFREVPIEEQLRITKDMGLDVFELAIANAKNDLPLDVSNEKLDEVKALCEKYGVKPLCAATGNDFTSADKTAIENQIKKVKRVIDICEYLGVKYLRIFAGFSPLATVVGDAWDNMIYALNQVYEYSKKVILTVETHGGVKGYDDGVRHFDSTTTDLDAINKIISQVKGIKFNFDPANVYAVNKDPVEFYKAIKDRVEVVHLKDFAKLESGHLVPSACGSSDMNWAGILKEIKDKNYPMLFEYENTIDIEEGCKKCQQHINKELVKL